MKISAQIAKPAKYTQKITLWLYTLIDIDILSINFIPRDFFYLVTYSKI